MSSDKAALGILLTYGHAAEPRHVSSVTLNDKLSVASEKAVVGFVGAGNYASRILIPAFKETGAILHSIASVSGTSAVVNGRRMGFGQATSDTNGLIANPEINAVS